MKTFLKHNRFGIVMDLAVVTVFALIGTSIILDYAGSNYANAEPWITKAITWITTNASVDENNTLYKPVGIPEGWGNSGASSAQYIVGEGQVLFEALEVDTTRIFGLSANDTDLDYASIDYGILLEYTGNSTVGANISVYESGVNKGIFFTNVTDFGGGELFYIKRNEYGNVSYYRNGAGIFYNSTIPSTEPLLVDAALHTEGATIANGLIRDPNHVPEVQSQNIVWVMQDSSPSTFGIILEASDLDEDPLEYYIVTVTSGGTLEQGGQPIEPGDVLEYNDVAYTPNPDFHGIDTIEFAAFDGHEFSNLGIITIYVWSHQRLDSTEGTEPTLSYAPNGDLFAFYNVGEEEAGEMVVRKRISDQDVFSPEAFVYPGGRTAALYYQNDTTIELAVDAGTDVRMFTSIDNGDSWNTGPLDFYDGREDDVFDSDAPMPLGFTTDLEYVEARLFFNYMTDYNQTNVYYAAKDLDGNWQVTAEPLPNAILEDYSNKTISGTYENGDHVAIFTEQGLLFDEFNQDLSFDFFPGDVDAGDPLNSTDMLVVGDDKPYFVGSYSQGIDNQTLFIRSSDFYANPTNWNDPIIIREESSYDFQIPHFALSENDGDMAVAWLDNDGLPQASRLLRAIVSEDSGNTWSDYVQTLVFVTPPQRIGIDVVDYAHHRGIDVENHGSIFSIAYSLMQDAGEPGTDDDTREGVYLIETDLGSPNVDSTWPADGGSTTDRTPNLRADLSDNTGLVSARMAVDPLREGGPLYEQDYTFQNGETEATIYLQVTTSLPLGWYDFYIYAEDEDGLHTTSWRRFRIKSSGGCFLKGTPVLLADGTTKPIEEMKIGDEIVEFDETTGRSETGTVKQVFMIPGEHEYLVINKQLKVTSHHGFYADGKWLEAGELSVGDNLLTPEGDLEAITSIEHVELAEDTTVYNLEVNPHHTFIAGERGYVVHNAEPIGGSSDGGLVDRNDDGGGMASAQIQLKKMQRYEEQPWCCD